MNIKRNITQVFTLQLPTIAEYVFCTIFADATSRNTEYLTQLTYNPVTG